MSALSTLLGSKLLKGTEAIDTDKALHNGNNKAIGLYFSAHWCPPCRGFTPKLAEWYTKDLQKAGLEIIFLSSDKDEQAFGEYFAEMPWLALPFHQRDLKNELSKKYKVQGIPSFVVLDMDGNVITVKGREAVSEDPTGADLPWKPPTLKEILDCPIHGKDGKPVDKSHFAGKTIGLYFSAHWCPPCRGFTPVLADLYRKIAADKSFEVIFISSDRDEEQFQEYYKEMPWLTLPYDNRKAKQQLSTHFDINGIPSLIILDENLQMINKSVVAKIRASPETAGDSFPWHPDLVREVDCDPEGIDEAPGIVLLQESLDKEVQKANKEALKPLAQKVKDETSEGEDPAFNFFACSENGRLASMVRSKCRVPEDKKICILLFDIPDSGSFYQMDYSLYESNQKITPEMIQKFIDDYKAKKLTKETMA